MLRKKLRKNFPKNLRSKAQFLLVVKESSAIVIGIRAMAPGAKRHDYPQKRRLRLLSPQRAQESQIGFSERSDSTGVYCHSSKLYSCKTAVAISLALGISRAPHPGTVHVPAHCIGPAIIYVCPRHCRVRTFVLRVPRNLLGRTSPRSVSLLPNNVSSKQHHSPHHAP